MNPSHSLSAQAKGKADAFKYFLEQRHETMFHEIHQRAQRRQQLEDRAKRHRWSERKKNQITAKLHQKESQYMRLRRTRVSPNSFRTIYVLGKGGYGEVRLVQMISNGEFYAMKVLRKADMIQRNQVSGIAAPKLYLIGPVRFLM
mgnify:CR=1 FL=1